ncbi:ABC transporter ATP-binding protein [Pseudaminobacter arsenicus]|uniref:ABC transporter ATP-binding protein n=1 Tax=Borborobacter arsenicus TaxID=1851146 RepID=A0A432V3H7_9HYPH|nr:ABC transporter ATP-binding protein [Pseudaminobacter arsenicus]RUM96706.1 ABC transporter ATP-binding protein [Pseudaminobacter arsenicus]
MTDLCVSGCTVAFGGLKAINDLTLTIPSGAITGLIGPNGSGKSTFCNMVSGQIPPSGGRVRLGEKDITGWRSDQAVAAGLARTYQVPRVPKELTIGEVIGVPFRYARSSRELPRQMSTTADLARFCGLAPALDTACADLSISDLRRLEIARALACKPRVLLLDEAMAGLSLEDTAQVIELVREVHAAGITIVVIEHVMRIIATLCQHAVVLNNGRLLSQGTPEVVLRDPAVREAYLGKGFGP